MAVLSSIIFSLNWYLHDVLCKYHEQKTLEVKVNVNVNLSANIDVDVEINVQVNMKR